MKTIRTPRGKHISAARYLALCAAQSSRTRGGGPHCAYGHFDCAAWDDGPCSAELASDAEPSDDSDVTVTVDADGGETFYATRR